MAYLTARMRVLTRMALAMLAALIIVLLTLSNSASADDGAEEMIRLISDHLTSARQLDGTYLAAVAAKDAAWQAYQLASTAMGIKVMASATSYYSERTEESRSVLGVTELQRQFSANQIAITARKPIYRPRETAAIDQAEAQFQGAEALLKAADNALFARVFNAWIEILTARDLVRIARDAFDRASAIRIETQRRYQSGEATIDQAGLEISRQRQRQAELFEAQSRQELAERMLVDLAGPNAMVPAFFTLQSAIPDPSPHLARDEILERVEQSNPELIAARFNERAAKLELEKRDADHNPTLDLYATASKGENDTASYIKNEQRVGVQLSVPIYTAGALTAAVSQAQAEYRKMQALTQAASVRLKAQASSAYSTMQSALVKIEASKTHIEAAGLRAEAVRRGFLAGTGTLGDLARAETEFLTARQRRASEIQEFAQAWALLSVATARMDLAFDRRSKPM